MSISAAQVKELRELTGAGMMDCKAALTETNGDMDAAVDWLRKKGIAKADKKSGRTAAEGLIGVDAGRARGRCRRGQLRDRFRRPQRSFPGIVRNVAKVALAHGGDHARRRPRPIRTRTSRSPTRSRTPSAPSART
jgi:elongation factor Ts